MSVRNYLIAALAGSFGALLVTHALARFGEPQAVWLWCELLKACR